MKKDASLLGPLLLSTASLTASAQAPTPTVQPADQDSVVRITTGLVQVQAASAASSFVEVEAGSFLSLRSDRHESYA